MYQQLGALTTQSTQLYDSMLPKASPAILSQDGPRVILDLMPKVKLLPSIVTKCQKQLGQDQVAVDFLL